MLDGAIFGESPTSSSSFSSPPFDAKKTAGGPATENEEEEEESHEGTSVRAKSRFEMKENKPLGSPT